METTLQETLPRHCYTEPGFFARECTQIFAREWFCVARASEFTRTGDYRVLDVAGESVVVVRSSESGFHAFYNVCRHRGSQLVPHECGDRAGGRFKGHIRCPYHSWQYALDGELKQTPHLDIDRSGLSLSAVEIDAWGGFLFVRLAGPPGAPGLIDSLGDIAGRVRRYPLAELGVGKRIDYAVAANWKVLAENYNECYHCAGVHPELCKIVPAFRRGGGTGLDWDRGIAHREGATTFTLSGTTRRMPFPGLDDDEKVRHKGELIYPNLFLSLAMDHVAAFTLYPRSPVRTDIACEFLFHPDEMANADFDPDDAVEFWDLTNRQDWAICENVQRGMRSRTFSHGYYAPMEDLSLDIRDYVFHRIPDAQETD